MSQAHAESSLLSPPVSGSSATAVPSTIGDRGLEPRSLDALAPHLGVLYNDGVVCVVNKPPDVQMASDDPSPDAVTLLNAVRRFVPPKPAADDASGAGWHFCHQLDFATSGVCVHARLPEAAAVVQMAFQERCTRKEYLAVVHGHLRAMPIGAAGVAALPTVGDARRRRRAAAEAAASAPEGALDDGADAGGALDDLAAAFEAAEEEEASRSRASMGKEGVGKKRQRGSAGAAAVDAGAPAPLPPLLPPRNAFHWFRSFRSAFARSIEAAPGASAGHHLLEETIATKCGDGDDGVEGASEAVVVGGSRASSVTWDDVKEATKTHRRAAAGEDAAGAAGAGAAATAPKLAAETTATAESAVVEAPIARAGSGGVGEKSSPVVIPLPTPLTFYIDALLRPTASAASSRASKQESSAKAPGSGGSSAVDSRELKDSESASIRAFFDESRDAAPEIPRKHEQERSGAQKKSAVSTRAVLYDHCDPEHVIRALEASASAVSESAACAAFSGFAPPWVSKVLALIGPLAPSLCLKRNPLQRPISNEFAAWLFDVCAIISAADVLRYRYDQVMAVVDAQAAAAAKKGSEAAAAAAVDESSREPTVAMAASTAAASTLAYPASCAMSPSSDGHLSAPFPNAHESPRFAVHLPIAEAVDDAFRMCIGGGPGNPGREATTLVHVLAYGTFRGLPISKVLLRPVTGRRHQLRVHLQHVGHPIVGDFNYAPAAEEAFARPPRMMLHAWRIELALEACAREHSFKARRRVAFDSASGGGAVDLAAPPRRDSRGLLILPSLVSTQSPDPFVATAPCMDGLVLF